MNTVNRLTWLSYLIFMFLGCMFISQGILILYISKTYQLSLAQVGYLLFILAAVQAVVTYFNGYLLEKTNLKTQIFIGLFSIFCGIAMMISGCFVFLLISLISLGIGNGILISVPNYLILTIHGKNKLQKLNILNFFFSVGGILGPLILGQLLEINCPWQLAVSIAFVFIALLFLFNKSISFSRLKTEDSSIKQKENGEIKWHYSIYLIAMALFFYVLSECIFSAWIVSYFKLVCNFSISQASLGLTIYWLFITFGRFASDKIGKYINMHQFILYSSSLAFIAYLLIFLFRNTAFDFIMIAIMGIGYAGLYASILSYGIDQMPYNCPKLMSFLVLAGTIGAILAMPLSSFFVKHFSILTALFVGLLILGLVIISIYYTLRDKNNPIKDKLSERNLYYLARLMRFYIKSFWGKLM